MRVAMAMVLTIASTAGAQAAMVAHPVAKTQALDLAKKAIARCVTAAVVLSLLGMGDISVDLLVAQRFAWRPIGGLNGLLLVPWVLRLSEPIPVSLRGSAASPPTYFASTRSDPYGRTDTPALSVGIRR